jgi:Flp pilus assembly pilin Flp
LERPSSKRGEIGVSAIEYALLASLVAMAILLAVYALSDSVTELYNNIATHVTSH